MTKYFEILSGVFAVVLTGSLARGRAVRDSCTDLAVFVEKERFGTLASGFRARTKAYSSMGGEVCYHSGDVEGGVEFGDVRVDLDFTDGNFRLGHMSFDIVRDEFETTIGNLLVYCVPLFEKGSKYQRLRSTYIHSTAIHCGKNGSMEHVTNFVTKHGKHSGCRKGENNLPLWKPFWKPREYSFSTFS